MKLYISGKITGLPIEEAKASFKSAVSEVESLGYEAINPMVEVPFNEEFKWVDYMLPNIAILLRKGDGVFMLKNWEDSKGARIEHYIAVETKQIIIYQK
jgi:hypothetical protein